MVARTRQMQETTRTRATRARRASACPNEAETREPLTGCQAPGKCHSGVDIYRGGSCPGAGSVPRLSAAIRSAALLTSSAESTSTPRWSMVRPGPFCALPSGAGGGWPRRRRCRARVLSGRGSCRARRRSPRDRHRCCAARGRAPGRRCRPAAAPPRRWTTCGHTGEQPPGREVAARRDPGASAVPILVDV
jgi:hypothetical protein